MFNMTAISPHKAIKLPANDESAGNQSAVFEELADGRGCHFSTYQTESVCVTSELWVGGDWRWRLTGPLGEVLVDCGGYSNRAECLTVVHKLRAEAAFASMPDQLVLLKEKD